MRAACGSRLLPKPTCTRQKFSLFVCILFFFFSSSLQTDLLKIMLEGGEETADPSLNTPLAHNKGILPILVPAAETEKKYCCLLAIFPDSGGHLYTCLSVNVPVLLFIQGSCWLVDSAGEGSAPCPCRRGREHPLPLAGAVHWPQPDHEQQGDKTKSNRVPMMGLK